MLSSPILALALSFVVGQSLALPAAVAPPSTNYINWKTFKANGVNLGGWLVQESTIDTAFWNQYSGGAPDEWGLCVNLGSQCGPVLEKRYASWITTSDIDKLAAANITLLRIPTTYAAWVKVPGSQLYSGNQLSFLKTISGYAINKYNMHIIIDIHSLPGGVNGMAFGEKEGNYGWFNNATALTYSYQAVDAAINFIQTSNFPSHFTLEPINEPVDNRNIQFFGTPLALSDTGAAWVTSYIKGVISRVAAVNSNIPVMFQDGFKGESYFSSSFPATANLVFDIHNYYFAGRGATSANEAALICSDAKTSAGDGKFPTFVGEWSIVSLCPVSCFYDPSTISSYSSLWIELTSFLSPHTASRTQQHFHTERKELTHGLIRIQQIHLRLCILDCKILGYGQSGWRGYSAGLLELWHFCRSWVYEECG